MKRLLSIIVMTFGITAAFAADKARNTVDRLWNEYTRFEKLDRPKDQAATLERIKALAHDNAFAWDFYKACREEVRVKSMTDWSRRKELEAGMEKDLEEFGSPTVLFHHRYSGRGGEEAMEFAARNRAELYSSRNPQFYTEDYTLRNFPFPDILPEIVANDYDYALWSIYAGGRKAARELMDSHFGSTYPYNALLRLDDILISGGRETRSAALKNFADTYRDKAISLYARQELLSAQMDSLEIHGCGEAAFRELDLQCDRLIADAKAFGRSSDSIEKAIAGLADKAADIKDRLRSVRLGAEVIDDVLRIRLSNLSSAVVEINRKGDKTRMFRQELKTGRKLFHVTDSLSLGLGFLEDGDYEIRCSSGKERTECRYEKHGISIAVKTDSRGRSVFTGDFESGRPVESFTLNVTDDSGKVLASGEFSSAGGFSLIPDSMFGKTAKRNVWLQAVTRGTDGRLRSSRRIPAGNIPASDTAEQAQDRTSCMILLDRSAFNPEETVHFKAIAYTGIYSFRTVPQGTALKAVISDPEGRILASMDLGTDEFGAAAGEYLIERGGPGGIYTVRIELGGDTIGSRQIRVDEFVLPTFGLEWDKDDRIYLTGDRMHVGGSLKSYSGHSLGGVGARYEIFRYSEPVRSGELGIGEDGRFDLYIDSGDQQYAACYNVRITVTGASGETLSFEKSVCCQAGYRIEATFGNKAAGRFSLKDGSEYRLILRDRELAVDYSIASHYSEVRTRPGFAISYSVLKGDNPVLEGQASTGHNSISLGNLKPGVYTLVSRSVLYSDDGRETRSERRDMFLLAGERGTALPEEVAAYFLEGETGDLSMETGSGSSDIWVVAELYGTGNRFLDGRLTKIGKGGIAAIGFEKHAAYPDMLSIRVLFFKDGKAFRYTREFLPEKKKQEGRLSFTRFLDTTVPSASYRFCINGPADAEYAVGIYDIASETIMGNRWSTVGPATRPARPVRYDIACGSMNSSYIYDYARPHLFGSRAAGRVMMKNSMAMDMMETVEEEVMAEAPAEDGGAGAEEVHVRSEFRGTLAWEPFLRSGKDGNVSFTFNTSDRLSTYLVQVFAHDKDMNNAVLSREMTVTLPVKISVIQPAFLYNKDRYSLRVGLSNASAEDIEGTLSMEFIDGKDYKDSKSAISGRKTRVRIPAGSSTMSEYGISVPDIHELGILVRFVPDNGDNCADAVFVSVPVRTPVQTVRESHSALLRDDASRASLTRELRRQFVNIPGPEAVAREISILQMLADAVPDRIEPESGDLLSLTEALYADILASRLPERFRAGRLDESGRNDIIDRILACRNADGGFAWLAELYSSASVTAVFMEWCAAMGDECDPRLKAVLPAAANYLDDCYLSPEKRPARWGGLSLAQYLHARALYPDVALNTAKAGKEALENLRKDAREYLLPSDGRGLQGRLLDKGRRISTLEALARDNGRNAFASGLGLGPFAGTRLEKSLDMDVESLSQYAVEHSSGGHHFPNAVPQWSGLLESDLYAHVLLCELMDAHGHGGIAEGVRRWIMIQKETRHWENDFAYIRALDCVLKGGEDVLGTKVLVLEGSTTLPFSEIRASGNGMTIRREYFLNGRRLQEGEVLHVGDRISARYTLDSDENRSFVRVTLPNCAAFDNVNGKSGVIYRNTRIYRNVLAGATEYWIDSMPKGETVFTEELYVNRAGSFQSAVPEMVSLYAPHYSANEGGHAHINVKD